ncbi:MAG: PfkB family carbohydrate kinase [Bacteroidota bacterium]
MSLLVIGTMAFDDLETPFGKAEMIIGGAGTYICWAASYFLEHQRIVSVVGDDFPAAEMDALRERGVNMDGVQIKEGEKSFYWAGKYHDDLNGRDTLATELNVLADFNPVLPESYKDSQYVMLGNLTPAIQMQVIQQMSDKPRLFVMDTMNYWMDTAWDDLMEVLKHIDVLTINDEEARQMSGEHSLVKAARKIRALGPKYLVIKKGEHGALLFHGEETFYVPAMPLEEVVDPTGAGDTFAGGFLGYLARTNDLSLENMKRAVVYGSAMASFTVEKFGLGQLKNLSLKDIETRIEKFVDLTAFDIRFGEDFG